MSNYSLIDTISQCCYPLNIRDYIGNVLLDISKLSSSAKFFKVVKGNDQVIAIKYNIPTTFKDRKFDIPVIIYILKNFPYQAPEVYLEKSSDTGVSPKNTSIDPKTNRIYTNILNNWNINSKIGDLISEIIFSFNTNFPIYKLNNNSGGSGSGSSSTSSGTMNSVLVPNMNTSYTSFVNNTSNSYQNAPTIYSALGIKTNTSSNVPNTNNNFNSGYNSFNINQTSYVPQTNTVYNKQNTIYNNIQDNKFQNFNDAPGINSTTNNSMNNNLFTSNTGTNNNYQNFNTQSTSNNINTSNTYSNNFSGGNYIPNNNSGGLFQVSNNNLTTTVPPISNFNSTPNITSNTLTNTNTNINTQVVDTQSEEIAKKVLMDEIKSQVESKVKEEMKRLKQQEEKLKNYQTEFTNQIEKYSKFLNRKDEIISTIRPLLERLEKEIQQVMMSVANSQDRMISQDTHLSFIAISDRDKAIINVISIEATIEDIITATKKAFEKGIVNFNDNVKFIRNITRELFRLKTYREKLLRDNKY
jgi:archaellum component FlaC